MMLFPSYLQKQVPRNHVVSAKPLILLSESYFDFVTDGSVIMSYQKELSSWEDRLASNQSEYANGKTPPKFRQSRIYWKNSSVIYLWFESFVKGWPMEKVPSEDFGFYVY